MSSGAKVATAYVEEVTQGVTPATCLPNGTKLVRAPQCRHASPISRAFLASCPADPTSARKAMIADRTICPGVGITSPCASAQSAKPHIIGWRVIA